MKRTGDGNDVFDRVTKYGIGICTQQSRVTLQRLDAPYEFADRMHTCVAQTLAESVRLKRNHTRRRAISGALCIAMIYLGCFASARAQSREVIRGMVTATSSGVLTIKSDTDGEVQVQLKSGAALMIAATASTNPNSVIAITLLSGVEPMLTATPADNLMMLTLWSLSSGAAGPD